MARERSGVEGRVRGKGPDRAVPRVERDDRARLRIPLMVGLGEVDAVHDRLLRRALELRVEREPDRVAGRHGRPQLDRADRPPERVDAELAQAGPSAKLLVERRLDPGLADLVTEQVPLARLQLVLGDLAHVAEDVRGKVAERVAAHERVRDRHARKLGLVLEQVVRLVLGDGVTDGHRRQGIAAVLLELAREVGERDLQDPREAPELGVCAVLGQVGGPDLDRGRARVLDEHPAPAVPNRAARRVGPHHAKLVVPRGDEILVPGQHLERPEPEEEHREGRQREEAEDPDAEDELWGQPVGSVDARVARQEAPRADRDRAASQRTRPPAAARGPRRGA